LGTAAKTIHSTTTCNSANVVSYWPTDPTTKTTKIATDTGFPAKDGQSDVHDIPYAYSEGPVTGLTHSMIISVFPSVLGGTNVLSGNNNLATPTAKKIEIVGRA
jgi:hypothetical protein